MRLFVLQIIRKARIAFIFKKTKFIERIYYACLNVFIIRFWHIWLDEKKKAELDSTLDQITSNSQNKKTTTSQLTSNSQHRKKTIKQQYFISIPALFSIEINSHTLVYLALPVI